MSFLNIVSVPDQAAIETSQGYSVLEGKEGRWSGGGVEVIAVPASDRLPILLHAPTMPVLRVVLRWRRETENVLLIMGDHWERGYGDLEWRGIVAEREMPWYFMTYDGTRSHGYGVETGTRSFCYWQVDDSGVSLTLDVRNGVEGVILGDRVLEAAVVVNRSGLEGESPFAAARAFCTMMCADPVVPSEPVYGGNNWYYAYGNSSFQEMMDDSARIADWAALANNRPFMVIDDGWQLCSGNGSCKGGPWTGNYLFPDMQKLAEQMKATGVKPGLWCRPLLVSQHVDASWGRSGLKDNGSHVLDPSSPNVLAYIDTEIRKFVDWGYELIKHDFSTLDIFGKWGYQMGASLTGYAQPFSDRSLTTAEIILQFYRTIAEASQNALIIGCNTVGHLAAGLFEIQRTGDDTSGKEWERTRKMGINTLAFRMPQHGAFFAADADCVGLTASVPWDMNKQWLELLAASGTPLFLSADPLAVGPAQDKAIRSAFELASRTLPPGEPLDWLHNRTPSRWLLNGETRTFDWYGDQGVRLNSSPEIVLR